MDEVRGGLKIFIFLFLFFGTQFLNAESPDSFFVLEKELPGGSVGRLKAGYLVQVVGQESSSILLRSFKPLEKSWKEEYTQKFPIAVWNKAAKSKPEAFDHKGNLYLRRGKNYFLVEGLVGPIACDPRGAPAQADAGVAQIFKAAVPQKQVPVKAVAPTPPPPAPSVEVWSGSPPLTSKDVAAHKARIQENIKWMEGLELGSHFNLNTPTGLSLAKRELIRLLQTRVVTRKITEADASDLISAMTLFGEFRGNPIKKSNGVAINPPAFPRSPAHLFYMMQVLENRLTARDGKGRFKFSNHRVSIFLPAVNKMEEEIKPWLARTPAGAALAENQFSSWNTESENPNLATMLSPAREASSSDAVYDDISTFLAKYRAGQYFIADSKPNPMIDHYDSATAHGKLSDLTAMMAVSTSRLWEFLKPQVRFEAVPLPAIRDSVTREKYEVDPRIFIGGR